jgi:hypothetical protein
MATKRVDGFEEQTPATLSVDDLFLGWDRSAARVINPTMQQVVDTVADNLFSSYIQTLFDNVDAANARATLGAQTRNTIIVGPGGDYDTNDTGTYPTGGKAIDTAVNEALTGDTVEVLSGTYVFGNSDTISFGGKIIRLKGAGKGKTTFQTTGSNTSLAFIYDSFGSTIDPSYRVGIVVEGITFDVNNDSNFIAMEIFSCKNLRISDCEIVNVANNVAIRVGHIGGTLGSETLSDIESSASRNVRIESVDIRDSDFGTREGILLINCQDTVVKGCHFENITGSPPAVVCPFGYNRNVIITNNTLTNTTAPLTYVQQSDHVLVSENTIHVKQDSTGFGTESMNARNSEDVYFLNNLVYGYMDGSLAAGVITIFDFSASTFDGHAVRYLDSRRIYVEGNNLSGCYTGILVPSQTTASHRLAQKDVFIRKNTIHSSENRGILVGSSSVDVTGMSDIFIEDNHILGGDYFDTGGITVIGSSTDPTAMRNVHVKRNRVTASDRPNACGVWIEDAEKVRVYDNDLEGAGKGTYAGSAVYLAGVVNDVKIRYNDGYTTENKGTATINSGTTSVTVTHGLAVTPTLDDISVVMGENPTNDPGNIWVDTITSTQFNINCRNDPGASNLDVAWRAEA